MRLRFPPRTHSRRGVAALIAATITVLVAGCSSAANDAVVTVTQRATVPPATVSIPADPSGSGVQGGPGAPVTVVAPSDSSGPADSSATDSPTGSASPSGSEAGASTGTATGAATATATGTATGTATATATPKPKAVTAVAVNPSPGATKVSPLHTIEVRTSGGVLVWVKIVNPDGKVVGGGKVAKKNATFWAWKEPKLGWGREYVVRTLTRSKDNVEKVQESTFTTMDKPNTVGVSVSPHNRVVGVAHPIVFKFSTKIADSYRRKVESMITITRTQGQPGAFRWFSQTELHWRPAGYWQAGSKVSIKVDIYGRQLSAGLFGGADIDAHFSVGRRVTSEVDAATHTMKVYQDFKLIKTIPVSLGNDKYPTYNGTHVVTEKHRTYLMDSSTWGLRGAGAYRTNVKWATRISNSGEFVHGAPWSEYAQGNSNVSHGCINMTDAAAQWFYAISMPGDPVTVKNSKGKQLSIYDGLGDWAVPFDKY